MIEDDDYDYSLDVNDSYRDNPLLKKSGVKVQYTQEQLEEYIKCGKDPIYFAENYIKIVNVDRGLMPFDMWNFQKEMIRVYHENRFSITKCPRQVGKTTTSVAYLLWLTLFSDTQNVAVLANKGSLARDILAKYQLAYENLPMWLQQGVVTWNKGNVELENGSKIVAASTSSSAIRGGSFNCVFLDEFGFVPNNIAEEFFNSVYPVISSGKTSKIIIVSTPNGMNLFYKLWMDAITGKNNYKTFEIHWSMVPGRDEAWKEETIRNTSERQFAQEFECEFLGSSNTLISGRKLQQIVHRDPDFVHDMVRIFERPVKEDGEKQLKDHLYCIMVDVAEGKGLDSSAFQVIDMTATPYRQVASYNSSSISPILFPTVIYNTARMYNDAYILVEVNNTNQIADTLHAEFEYENLWKVHTGNKKPQQLSTGFARGVQMGVKMSPQVKRIGCTNLRSLVEADKLIIQDFNTYSELTTFIAQKNSWSAESGANDDMVMCLVMFAWVTTQKYFREIVNHDIRKQLQLENMNQIDEITPPEMIVEDGLSHGFAVMGGDVWEDAHFGGVYQNWVNDALKQF
jgi:Terminase large subunit, T4likevirus-type, N-terminal/Terminase RNaseH-like domain